MNDSTRFTLAKFTVVAATFTGLVALTACESGGGTVSGRLDDVKYVKPVKSVPAVTHKETRRERQTRQVCTGTGTERTCKTVDDGFKTRTVTVVDKPGKPGKPAMYCVELDAVGNDTTENDRWFKVSSSTYRQWADKEEGVKVSKMPYERELNSCKH